MKQHPNAPGQLKPYHEMTLEEYSATGHSQTVPRWSILAIPPESYSRSQLCQFGQDSLNALAFVWGVRRDRPKEQLADRIVRRSQFRSRLAKETETSLSVLRRSDLALLAKEAGVYHPWLNRKALAASLIQWREHARKHAKLKIAEAHHEQIVGTAARKGLSVPRENLSRYGLDAQGNTEPTIFGVPLSRALQTGPEAIEAARALTKEEFCQWLKENSALASRLVLLQTGILGDDGACIWREVRRVCAPPEIPPLFAAAIAPDSAPVPQDA